MPNSAGESKVKSVGGLLRLQLEGKSSLANSPAETVVPANSKKQIRIYQCPECPKTFVKNSNFKQHLG